MVEIKNIYSIYTITSSVINSMFLRPKLLTVDSYSVNYSYFVWSLDLDDFEKKSMSASLILWVSWA